MVVLMNDHHLSPFDHIPNEILELIFEFLPTRDRLRLRLVCRRWHRWILSRISTLQIFINANFVVGFDAFSDDSLHLRRLYNVQNGCFFLLRQAGNSLQKLCLNLPFMPFIRRPNLRFTNELFPTLEKHCPNLIYLDYKNLLPSMCPPLLKWLDKYGQQLKGFTFNEYMNVTEVIKRLNPERLTSINLLVDCKDINKIINQLPLLTELNLYFDEKSKITLKDLTSLKSLHHLQSFSYRSRYQMNYGCLDLLGFLLQCSMLVRSLNTLDIMSIGQSPKSYSSLTKLTNLCDLKVRIYHPISMVHALNLKHLNQLTLIVDYYCRNQYSEFLAISQLKMLTSLTIRQDDCMISNLPFHQLKSMPKINFLEFQQSCRSLVKLCPLPYVIDAFPNLQILHFSDHKLTREIVQKQLPRLFKLRTVRLLVRTGFCLQMSNWKHLNLSTGVCCSQSEP